MAEKPIEIRPIPTDAESAENQARLQEQERQMEAREVLDEMEGKARAWSTEAQLKEKTEKVDEIAGLHKADTAAATIKEGHHDQAGIDLADEIPEALRPAAMEKLMNSGSTDYDALTRQMASTMGQDLESK
jgi:hypothetical protein